MLIPYREIGYAIALLLCLVALVKAAKKIKFIIGAIIVIFFILPFFIPSVVDADTLFYLRMMAAIGCYLYLRIRGIACRC